MFIKKNSYLSRMLRGRIPHFTKSTKCKGKILTPFRYGQSISMLNWGTLWGFTNWLDQWCLRLETSVTPTYYSQCKTDLKLFYDTFIQEYISYNQHIMKIHDLSICLVCFQSNKKTTQSGFGLWASNGMNHHNLRCSHTHHHHHHHECFRH